MTMEIKMKMMIMMKMMMIRRRRGRRGRRGRGSWIRPLIDWQGKRVFHG